MFIIFSIDLVQYQNSTLILKCFLQFTCTNLDDCQKEWGNFLNLLQKEGGSNPGGNYDYFMENLPSSRNPCFCAPGSYCYQSMTLRQKCGQSHSLNSMQNVLEKLTVFQFMPTLYHDHENFSKSTTIFIQTFIKTIVILRVTKHFWGKLWVLLGENFACRFYLTTIFHSA